MSPGLLIDSIIDLLNIPDHAASVLVSGINVGERLIGGKRAFIYVPEGQSQIVWNLKPETVNPLHNVFRRLSW